MKNEEGIGIIKKLIEQIEKTPNKSQTINKENIKEKIKAVNRKDADKKLRSLGLSKAADMLRDMSDEDIIKELSKNPDIIKKINNILKEK